MVHSGVFALKNVPEFPKARSEVAAYVSRRVLQTKALCLLAIYIFGAAFAHTYVADENDPISLIIYSVCTLLSLVAMPFLSMRIKKDPKDDWQRYYGPNGLRRLFTQDLTVLKVLRHNPLLILPLVTSLAGIAVLFVTEIRTGFITGILRELGVQTLVSFYLFTCVLFSLYFLGFIVFGELLQRKLKESYRPFLIELFIDFLLSLPFIAFVSFTWILWLISAIFTKNDNHPTSFSSILDLLFNYFFYAIFKLTKYYTYLNLTIIAFEDKKLRSSLKDSLNFAQKHFADLAMIWVRSGFGCGLIFLFSLATFGWNEILQFIDSRSLALMSALCLIMYYFISLLSEQINVFFYYIRVKHKKCDLDGLMKVEANRSGPL